MIVQTTRFGPIQIIESDLITFKEGLLGFSDFRQFILLDDPKDEIFAWMQSCEDPKVAFPVLEPELFISSYKPKISGKSDIDALGLREGDTTRLFNIVTVPEDVTNTTANLKAPIIININTRMAKQVIVQENDYPIKYPIFAELQKRWIQNPALNFKAPTLNTGVAVRLPNRERPNQINA